MCGIAGFSLAERSNITSRGLARGLLHQIESRGTDATGASWVDANGETWYLKDDIPARAFHMRSLPDDSTLMILHTRWATKGSPKVPGNNHPIHVPGVVGVHNGHVRNDDEIIAMLGGARDADVDSEAIFRLVADRGVDALVGIDGAAAIAWIETADPDTLHLARLSTSPLTVAQTSDGSFVFASTRRLLLAGTAGLSLDFITDVPEWTYIEVRAGVIHTWRTIFKETHHDTHADVPRRSTHHRRHAN